MPKTIWKFELNEHQFGVQTIQLPHGSLFRHVAMKKEGELEKLTLWFEVEASQVPFTYKFIVIRTGETVPEGLIYLGTAVRELFVAHIYQDPTQ